MIICTIRNSRIEIQQRRERLWTLLTRGMKTHEIARELNVDHSTISTDIKFLTAESQNYLNILAKETLPFMYQTSVEGIRSIMKECWDIYSSNDESINWTHRLAALKLAKECNEAVCHVIDEGPSVMYVKQLQEKLVQIESRQIR